MNPAHSLCGRWLPYALSISALSLIGLIVLGKGAEGKKAKRDAKAVAKMVEDIASPNKAPKIVDRPDKYPNRVPQFPKGYDWKDQRRVYKARVKLYEDTSVELWEELVRKAPDRRYSLTVTSQQSGDSYNFTVGGVCNHLAYSRLIGVFQQHMPLDPNHDGFRLRLDVCIKSLPAWRKERKDKSLYQLQIEVCERALKELQKVKRVSQTKKEAARKKIEAEIEKLRKTKRPIFIKIEPGAEVFVPYTGWYPK
jgi:hypothetical protein